MSGSQDAATAAASASAAAAAAAALPVHGAAASASQFPVDLLQQLVRTIEGSGGAQSVEGKLRSMIAAMQTGQTRIASPGLGLAPQVTPFGVQQAAASAADHDSVVSGVHIPLGSAHSAATARTPIMRHAAHAKEDEPFTVQAEKAYKAPELTDRSQYATWRSSFSLFVSSYGVAETLQGYRFIVLPTTMAQLTAEERLSLQAGFELQPSLVAAAAVNDRVLKRAQIEFDKCCFAAQALLHAVQKVPFAVTVVTAVPSPNIAEMWRRLEQALFPQTAIQVDIAEQEFASLRQDPQEDIASYAARTQALCNKLAMLQTHRSVHQQCSQWVRGICSLSQTRRDMLRMHPFTAFEAVVALAREWEQEDVLAKQRQHQYNRQPQSANMADTPGGDSKQRNLSRVECHSCHKKGHMSRHCPEKSAAAKAAVCGWCGVTGHFEADCFKKQNGFPKTAGQNATTQHKQVSNAQSGGSGGSGTGGGVQANMFERVKTTDSGSVALAAVSRSADPYALVDTGANEHVLRDLPSSDGASIESDAALPTVPIRTAGGQILEAQQAGDVSLELVNGDTLHLGSALHHTGAARNLLSVYKLIMQHNLQGVYFTRETAEFITSRGSIMCTAVVQNGVYALALANSVAQAFDVSAVGAPAVSIQVWHARLNHASATVLNRLIKGKSLAGFDASRSTTVAELDCEACRLGKQPHCSHASAVPAEYHATSPLERVDWDYFGPVSTVSLGGAVGALVGVCRFSNYGWVFLLKARDQIQARLIEWAEHMRNRFARYPAIMHFDNAPEFLGDRLSHFCEKNGIKTSYSPFYDAALNGAAERFIRTIIEAATTALLRAGSPKVLWGEATLVAAHVYNLVRTNEGDDLRTAEQRLSGAAAAPRVHHLRAFGCTAYVRLESVDVPGKFDAVASKQVFVGYADVGAWRFIHPTTARVTVSIHAKFVENDFTAMATLRQTLQETDEHAEEEDDNAYFGRIAEKNEIELAKFISLQQPQQQQHQDAASAEPDVVKISTAEPHPIPAGQAPPAAQARGKRAKGAAPTRQMTRSNRGQPPARMGMVSPGDIGQAQRVEVCAFEAAVCAEVSAGAPSPPSDPRTWREAMAREPAEAAEWVAGFRREEDALIAKKVFVVVDSLPPGARCLGTKLVMKTVRDGDGRIAKENPRKVRLTAMGNEQRAGIDYEDTWSSAMTLTSLRVLLCIAAFYSLIIGHIDVCTAYLNADLDRPQYMRAPQGMHSASPGQFLKLLKALYGLHQSGRLWAELLISILLSIGFTQCQWGDPYVLVRRSRSGRFLFIGVYVDDMPTAVHAEDQTEMGEVIEQLRGHFKITVQPEVHTLLGMRIIRDATTGAYRVHQQAYVEKMLEQFGMAACNPCDTPESTSASSGGSPHLSDAAGSAVGDSASASAASGGGARATVTLSNFRAVVGALYWLCNGTRYDIAHAVNRLARSTANPDEGALSAARRVLRYLAGTRSHSLIYSPPIAGAVIPTLEAFSDSDYAGDEATSKSTSGGLLKLNKTPVHWFCKLQSTVSRSSSEAEYVAAGECGRVIVWLRVLLAELGCAQTLPTPLRVDNETAIAMTTDDGQSFPRRKHIRVVYHWIREAARDGFLVPVWVPTELQQADLLTKSLGRIVFQRLCQLIAGTVSIRV